MRTDGGERGGRQKTTKMLPRTKRGRPFIMTSQDTDVFKVVPPVPSNFRKWAVDREALELYGNGPSVE